MKSRFDPLTARPAVSIAIFAAATISTTVTSHFVSSHGPASLATGAALTHGFEIAFYVLAALSLLGAVAAAVLVEPKPKTEEVVDTEHPEVAVLEPA